MTEGVMRPRLEAMLGFRRGLPIELDRTLLIAVLILVGIGLVMVASASVAVAEQNNRGQLHFLLRQILFLLPAGLAAFAAFQMPLATLRVLSGPLLLFGFFLLMLVLVPGVGHEANGATRWLPLGPINLQVSEVARVCLLIYMAGYLQRHGAALKTTAQALVSPALILAFAAVLLLAQPDFGALAVLAATIGSVFFIAGLPMLVVLALLALAIGLGWLLIFSSPYRLERLTAFRDPWADPFDSGFQLAQSLIAVGRGEWFGVGLGNSVQKLFYLPEAHTDFVFAVLAEELGFVGMSVVILLYGFIVLRACRIGSASFQAGEHFGGLLAYGIAVSLGLQAFINMGVNLGLLPTKGLTLPLMSYGGSSLVMSAAVVGILLRVDRERRQSERTSSAIVNGGGS
ncbi:MAG: putative lipid II flippase FtsW [Spiribacter sp.]|nr:putative lipid II flippase FtsW [Spiribacter sp.]MDR9489463.1 putative lipid II flippase FtsW [Spiribacter sp.]